GYETAIIGKWHLNFQYCDPKSGEAYSAKDYKSPPVGTKIPDGPISRGFDYYHGFHHARDMQTVIENDTVIAHDAPINMLPRLTRKSVEYIDQHAESEKPFFLYVPLGSPHTPILPTKAWQGKSGLGDYGDFVMETDHALGEICRALERNNLADNTLVIFSSDNGCSKAAGIGKLAKQGHRVSGDLRGSKADIWDGGHRVPFIVRWQGTVEPGSTSDQTICLTDLFATAIELVDAEVPAGSCEDSVSFLPALRGETIQSTRAGIVHHSISGHFGYRQGPWKLALARGSGGWSSPNEKQAGKSAPKAQLYHMIEDIGEQENRYDMDSSIAEKLLQQLRHDVRRGRSNFMSRILTWLFAATLVVCGSMNPVFAAERPNILFIITDDQSPFDFKFYNPESKLDSPVIDRLASEGMVFDAAYHMGSWSGAVCTPSRHMVMSGRTVWHIPSRMNRKRNPNESDNQLVPPNLEKYTMAAVFNGA
ncbi:unnamed protein product, partial [Symbiodinium microadriaticum]